MRDEQKLFDAMDASETGRYLPTLLLLQRRAQPHQKGQAGDIIAKLNRIQLHLDDLVTDGAAAL